MSVTWTQSVASLTQGRRYDPEYFDPRATKTEDAVAASSARPLSEWVKGAQRGSSPSYDVEGTTRVIKTAHVQKMELLANPQEFVRLKVADTARSSVIPRNSLLITSTGVGSAGRCFLYTGDDTLVADGHVTILPLIGSETDGAYLCAYLQSSAGRQQIIRLHRGSSRQIEIYPADLLTLLIPDLTAERRAEIGAAWLEAARGIETAHRAVNEAVQMVASMVGLDGPTPPPDGATIWEERFADLGVGKRLDPEHAAPNVRQLRVAIEAFGSASLLSLATSHSKGVQPEAYTDTGDTRVIKSKDVHYPEFDLNACERAVDDGWGASQLCARDLLLNTTGEGTLGRSGIVPTLGLDEMPTVAAVDICILKIDLEKALPEYVALFLNSWMGRQQTTALQTGSSGQQHLYPPHFARVKIPMPRTSDDRPDLAKMAEIVAHAETRSAAVLAARQITDGLDRAFAEALGVDVDLGTIPY